MKKLLFAFLLVSTILNLDAQDRHFTQFYSSATYLNPALAGGFGGKYKVSAIYRDQWASVLDKPITTIGAALEVNIDMNKIRRSKFKDKLGIGLSLYSDKIAGSDLNTTQMALSLAYHKNLDQDGNHFVSVGFEPAIGQKNINYENLTFHSQFDWKDGYVYPNGETLPQNNFSFFDLATGINYSYTPKRKTALFVGAAIHHINSPQISFFYDKEKDTQIGDNKLFKKYTLHGGAQIPVVNGIKINPRVLYSIQGPHSEINAGTSVQMKLKNTNTALVVGSWARFTQQENAQNLESIIALVGVAIDHVQIGLSYDINLGHLSKYSSRQGVFEFTVAYLGEYDDDGIVCPKF